MRKQISIVFVIIILGLGVLVSMPYEAQAQTPSPTPSPVSAVTSQPTSSITVSSNSDVVTFTQLQQSEIQLNGPYDSYSLLFSVPEDWALKADTQLELLVGVSFNTVNQSQSNVFVLGGGTLTVLVNDAVLAVLPLNQVGEFEQKIPISLASFNSTRTDGRTVLRFVLDTGVSCNIAGAHTVVFIHPTSYLKLPHEVVNPPTSLVNFPRPIFQNSFTQDSALLVVPDQPSSEELQAALTVGAGLGSLSGGAMALDMATVSSFASSMNTSTLATANNLIFLGKPSSLPVLSQLALPLPVTNGKFQDKGGGADDGVVEMVGSPWSHSHVVLVVSGNTDQGVIKAAQAVSTGILRPNRSQNLAVVSQVNLTPVSNTQAVDRSLKGLGYAGTLFQDRGIAADRYVFRIPVGMTVTPDAYFELVFGHSALLDYNRSQIVVLLNDQPIGSVRMSDITADLPTNHARIMIPSSVVVPGNNRLDVRVNIIPIDDCTPPNALGLWVKVWPESLLHLPVTATSVNSVGPQNLATYPVPFVYSSVLDSTAFVLEHNSLDSWRDALQVAAFLGVQANAPLVELSTFYGDNVPPAERTKYNFLMIGRPSEMPVVKEINDKLPAPFSPPSDIASDKNLQVQYRIPSDSPMGYVETLVSPWNPDNIVLAILGNTSQGVDWAASALTDPTLRSRMGGNYAIINDRQVITSTTSLLAATNGETPAAAVNSPVGPSNITPSSDVEARPLWIIPVLLLSLVLIAAIVALLLFRSRSRNQRRSPKDT